MLIDAFSGNWLGAGFCAAPKGISIHKKSDADASDFFPINSKSAG